MRIRMFANDAELEAKQHWHPWFAWKPVFADGGYMIWLEVVYRKMVFRGCDDAPPTYIYRRMTDDKVSAVLPSSRSNTSMPPVEKTKGKRAEQIVQH